MAQCEECGKSLGLLSKKHRLKEGLLCDSCYQAWKDDVIFEFVSKYLSTKDEKVFANVAGFHENFLEQIDRHSVKTLRESLQTYTRLSGSSVRSGLSGDDIDRIITQREASEWTLGFLDDLEMLYKLLRKKGVETDYKELMSAFAKAAEDHFRQVYDPIITASRKLIRRKLGRNLTKEGVVREYMRIVPIEHTPEEISRLLDSFNFQYSRSEIEALMSETEEEMELEKFERSLSTPRNIEIGDFEDLDGYEFEKYLRNLFELLGYTVLQTSLSGDQGADLIISKDGEKTVVQAKKHRQRISNKAVQEVVAARSHYGAEKAVVVTNSTFTKSAIELALSNDVELWDGSKLREVVKGLQTGKEDRLVTQDFVKDMAKRLENEGVDEAEILNLVAELEALGVDSTYAQEFLEEMTRVLESAESTDTRTSVEYVEGQYVYPVNTSCPYCGGEFTRDVDVTEEEVRFTVVECPHCGWEFEAEELSKEFTCNHCSQAFGTLEEAEKHVKTCEAKTAQA